MIMRHRRRRSAAVSAPQATSARESARTRDLVRRSTPVTPSDSAPPPGSALEAGMQPDPTPARAVPTASPSRRSASRRFDLGPTSRPFPSTASRHRAGLIMWCMVSARCVDRSWMADLSLLTCASAIFAEARPCREGTVLSRQVKYPKPRDPCGRWSAMILGETRRQARIRNSCILIAGRASASVIGTCRPPWPCSIAGRPAVAANGGAWRRISVRTRARHSFRLCRPGFPRLHLRHRL